MNLEIEKFQVVFIKTYTLKVVETSRRAELGMRACVRANVRFVHVLSCSSLEDSECRAPFYQQPLYIHACAVEQQLPLQARISQFNPVFLLFLFYFRRSLTEQTN